MDPDEAIYEAATFAKVPKWPLLRAFLLKKGVELTVLNTKSSKDWMDELSAAREELNAMIVEVEDAKLKKQRAGSDKVEERERSMVSRRDSRESSDSGYHTAPFKDLNDRPEAVTFLVPDHDLYDDGKAILYCNYCDDDDQNYIARTALEKLQLREGADGKVSLFFIEGGRSSNRKFIAQDCTSKGEKLESDILFGMKTPTESVAEEGPLEEISNVAFDGGDDRRNSNTVRQTDIMAQRQPLRQLHDDEVKLLGYAVGLAVNNPDEDLSTLGHRLGMVAGAAMESFPR